jgi:hypothetical protein
MEIKVKKSKSTGYWEDIKNLKKILRLCENKGWMPTAKEGRINI